MDTQQDIDALLESASIPSDVSLTRCRQVAQQIQDEGKRIESLEADLTRAKAEFARLSTEILPTIMQECGLTDFGMLDGQRVEVSPRYFAHISAENRTAAHEWLRENDLSDLIKTEVTATFGRGDDVKARELADKLKDEGLDVDVSESVNANTLKSFVKERYQEVSTENPGPLPPEKLFGVHIVQMAEIKKGKTKKK